jgi:MFS family permease
LANGLGWGFDGMDGVMFALVSPLIINEFALDIPTYRSGLQIALLVGITGLYFWPWLADRYGRRTLLAINIALFSVLMPVVALSPTFAVFVAGRSVVGFALTGEWSLGSMLVAETWPARLRGRVISINRATWRLGAALAGAITGIAAATWGWRVAVMVPGVIALLAIYVRTTCPESPYWVRAQDRKRQIAATVAAGAAVDVEDRAWFAKAGSVGIRRCFCRTCCQPLWSRCSSLAPAAASSVLSAAGCPTTSRPRRASRLRSTAPFTYAGASSAFLACGWRVGSLTGSAVASALSRC